MAPPFQQVGLQAADDCTIFLSGCESLAVCCVIVARPPCSRDSEGQSGGAAMLLKTANVAVPVMSDDGSVTYCNLSGANRDPREVTVSPGSGGSADVGTPQRRGSFDGVDVERRPSWVAETSALSTHVVVMIPPVSGRARDRDAMQTGGETTGTRARLYASA